MDAGSFILELDGVRWALDLGAQDYNSLESKGIDLWNRAQDSQRWSIFRLNSRSHNTLSIDDQLHRVGGHANFASFAPGGPEPQATIDLSPVFAGQARRVLRTFQVDPLARRVTIQDDLAGLPAGARVRWAMVTSADVDLDGPIALLHERGRSLVARIIAPSRPAVGFEVIPADPPKDDFNAPNPGRRILIATFTAPSDGALSVRITLAAAPITATVPP
jgi:hypothetical protein